MKRRNKEEKIIILLAYYIRYGYWVTMIALEFLIKSPYVFFVMSALYGLYHLIGLRYHFRHLYCSMQDAYHENMSRYNSGNYTDEMKKDILGIGCFFLIIGVIGILIFYFNIK